MKYRLIFPFIFFFNLSFAQQISIPRVDKMPDFPQPYNMRDWKQVAQDYDKFVFNLQTEGEYLPLASLVENTTNYPDHPALAIQTYVGTNSPPGMEAINVLPAVVGATLAGIDKSDQDGHNWPLYCEEYFNRRPSENVYLNNPVASSGNDWWYETMPNVFFYQLNYFYPHTGDFDYQVTTLADRWLEAVEAMGGSTTPWSIPYMNYRAFNLSTMTPLETGVKEPEAAGALGWILYQAYKITGQKKYRIGAELCLDFLNDLTDNPSYELQLPYGVYIAARMNAEQGTEFNIEKMMNWCFDKGDLRGWGVITGNWNGNDMDGLIGEVNEPNPDYVFNMNSLEQAGALVPAVRYDDRFATAIAKWVLNAANASRFYFSEFLPDNMEDNAAWTSVYDTNATVAYEALREKEAGPYGTGDAMNGGWAQTNLGLYGASHVGIFGGIIRETDVEGILQLNLLATDYYAEEAYPTYLYFNPYGENKQVAVTLPDGSFDIYDAVANEKIKTNVAGTVQITIKAKSSVMAVFIPANSEIIYSYNKALVNNVIIDYNAGQNVVNYPPRIKALSVKDTTVIINDTVTFYCTAEDRETETLEYAWTVGGIAYDGGETLEWQAPPDTGVLAVICTVTDEDGLTAADTLYIRVVEKINYPPEIEKLEAGDQILAPGSSTTVTCTASDPNDDEITYYWQASAGQITGDGSQITFTAPEEITELYITCTVKDPDNESDKDSLFILVRDTESGQTGNLVLHYEFNGNTNDLSEYGNNGNAVDCKYVEDMSGSEKKAISFYTTNSKVTVPNNDDLNFQDGLTVCYWIKVNQYYDHESYPVSHGNWTTRWKTSLTDEFIRFTINGSNGIIDVDSKTILETGKWYHVACVYNGTDCLVFIDGKPEGYKPFEGQINQTTYDLVLGQDLPDQTGFNFNGVMDKLRIYNYGISYEKVKEIYQSELLTIAEKPASKYNLKIFPNPANDELNIEVSAFPDRDVEISVTSLNGQTVIVRKAKADNRGLIREKININRLVPGSYYVSIKDKKTSVTGIFIKEK